MNSPRDGTEKTYYPDGKLEGEVTYVNGHVNGVTRHWHPNGVLEFEIPVRNDIVDGTAKFWNDKGELLGTYEIRNGNGIQKAWHQDGSLAAELTLVGGAWTGRQRTYFPGGELIGETYWLNSKQVSKKKYLEACKKNPSLPRYDDEPQAKVDVTTRPKGPTAQNESEQEDSLTEQLVAAPGSREVLEWLQEGPATRTLGELATREASIELVKEVYDLGASKVMAVKIDRYPDGQENTGKLVICLPKEKVARKKLFAWAAEKAEKQGYDPEPDAGQKHLFVMLD